jgi:hypothetical protein
MGHDWLAAACVLGLYPPHHADVGMAPGDRVRLQTAALALLLGTVAATFVLRSPALIVGATVLLTGMMVAALPAVGTARRSPTN